MKVSVSPWQGEGLLLCESRICQEHSQEKKQDLTCQSSISVYKEVGRTAQSWAEEMSDKLSY